MVRQRHRQCGKAAAGRLRQSRAAVRLCIALMQPVLPDMISHKAPNDNNCQNDQRLQYKHTRHCRMGAFISCFDCLYSHCAQNKAIQMRRTVYAQLLFVYKLACSRRVRSKPLSLSQVRYYDAQHRLWNFGPGLKVRIPHCLAGSLSAHVFRERECL